MSSIKEEKNLIEIQLNFFGPFFEEKDMDDFLKEKTKNPVVVLFRESLCNFLNISASSISREVLIRYIEITTEKSHVAIVPRSEKIVQKLLEPLKIAKKSYCFGDYLATVALCGMTAEMLSILIWEINDIRLKGQGITKNQENKLFGKKFTRLSQYRRLEILKVLNLISDNQFKLFDGVREKRNDYLHSWVIKPINQKADALAIFKDTFKLFMEIINIGITSTGTVKIDQKVLAYLNKTKQREAL